jgi:uncharacterized protein (TIGR00290 family)
MTSSVSRAAVSWSGGKDSCLALLRARRDGHDGRTLLTMMDEDGPSKSHGLPAPLLQAQADAMDVAWLPVAASLAGYGRAFAEALEKLRACGHTHMIFGDIDLQAHRHWLEPACRQADLVAVFPLWGRSRAAVAAEVIAAGIKARLVCVDAGRLREEFCGAEYDAGLLARLPGDVCPCGEGGEFHTFVWDAPCFRHPLCLARGPQRRVRSVPPLAPTDLVFEIPELASA